MDTQHKSSYWYTVPPAFWLVVIMLVTLFVLILSLLGFVKLLSPNPNEDAMEFGKWVFSVLLGAFGAWIGAGAAYFFGKENLKESSRSTEEALRIQQKGLLGTSKPERIKDIVLTVLNKEFMFKPKSTKDAVVRKLNDNKGYWWVPVFDDDGKGLADIIHARVFWDSTFQDSDPVISTIISTMDTNPDLKVLHGDNFFVKVTLDDKITDVIDSMNKSGAAVGIVVDEKNKPSYCFTKQDILSTQQ